MYRYGSSSKQFTFRSDSPLSNAQIMQHAPSVMAAEAHASRGDRYAFIPTMTVLDGLRDNGFQPFEVRQTKCRDASKREFTRHMVRMRGRQFCICCYGSSLFYVLEFWVFSVNAR